MGRLLDPSSGGGEKNFFTSSNPSSHVIRSPRVRGSEYSNSRNSTYSMLLLADGHMLRFGNCRLT